MIDDEGSEKIVDRIQKLGLNLGLLDGVCVLSTVLGCVSSISKILDDIMLGVKKALLLI